MLGSRPKSAPQRDVSSSEQHEHRHSPESHSGTRWSPRVVPRANETRVRCAYRLVSAGRLLLQFVATMTSSICSTFQSRAARCSLSSRTFNPKVAGSIPARPIDLQGKGELHASKNGLLRVQNDVRFSGRAAARCGFLRLVAGSARGPRIPCLGPVATIASRY